MVNYLVAVNSTKTTTYISKKCFEDVINVLAEQVQNIKINYANNQIKFFQKENNVEISIEIKVAKSVKSLSDKISELKSKIEFSTLTLLGFKPKNIIIYCLGTY